MIDYMVMEAVAIRAGKAEEKERQEAEKEAERKRFKKDTTALDQYR